MGWSWLACGCVRHSGNSCQPKSLPLQLEGLNHKALTVVWFPHATLLNSSPQLSSPLLEISTPSWEWCRAPVRKNWFSACSPWLCSRELLSVTDRQRGVLQASQRWHNYIQNRSICSQNFSGPLNYITTYSQHGGKDSPLPLRKPKRKCVVKDHPANKNNIFPQILCGRRLPQRITCNTSPSKMGSILQILRLGGVVSFQSLCLIPMYTTALYKVVMSLSRTPDSEWTGHLGRP